MTGHRDPCSTFPCGIRYRRLSLTSCCPRSDRVENFLPTRVKTDEWHFLAFLNGHPTSIQVYSPTEKSRQSYSQWLARPFFPGLDMLRFLYGSAFFMEVFGLLCSHSCALPARHPLLRWHDPNLIIPSGTVHTQFRVIERAPPLIQVREKEDLIRGAILESQSMPHLINS